MPRTTFGSLKIRAAVSKSKPPGFDCLRGCSKAAGRFFWRQVSKKAGSTEGRRINAHDGAIGVCNRSIWYSVFRRLHAPTHCHRPTNSPHGRSYGSRNNVNICLRARETMNGKTRFFPRGMNAGSQSNTGEKQIRPEYLHPTSYTLYQCKFPGDVVIRVDRAL